jgi:hypothetical protein
VDAIERAIRLYERGDVEKAARMIASARRSAASSLDEQRISEIDGVVAQMQSHIPRDDRPAFDAALSSEPPSTPTNTLDVPLVAWLAGGAAALSLFIPYSALQSDPAGDGDCFPSFEPSKGWPTVISFLVFLVLTYATFHSVARAPSGALNGRSWFKTTIALAVAWCAFAWWLFPHLVGGIDLTHTMGGHPAPTPWVMSLGPVAALFLAEGCLLGVGSSRWGAAGGATFS